MDRQGETDRRRESDRYGEVERHRETGRQSTCESENRKKVRE
jgi:hypothetical protein